MCLIRNNSFYIYLEHLKNFLSNNMSMNFYVGAVWFEQTMFTLRDRIYSPALHHRRSCTPNCILFVGVTGFEPIESRSAGFTDQCSSTIWAALPNIFQTT